MIPDYKALNRMEPIKLICLDCGSRFTSDDVIWATLDAYGPCDEMICSGCEGNNLGRDDEPPAHICRGLMGKPCDICGAPDPVQPERDEK
jgi:hypothetical protein